MGREGRPNRLSRLVTVRACSFEQIPFRVPAHAASQAYPTDGSRTNKGMTRSVFLWYAS
jgi:hypothetical protein